MILRRLIASLRAVLVIAGLAVAPLATPAAAAMTSSHAEMMDAASMSGSMPCCPDENNAGCPDCPLAALCVSKITPAAPVLADAIPMRLSTRTAHTVSDDAPSYGLDRPPPDHPPRILV
jgi:hypothetical protein